MGTRRVTPGCAAGLLVLLLRCFGLAEPSEFSGDDSFTIVNENTGKCIQPLSDWIVAQDCSETRSMLWKWVSQHRLFHLESQKCLGLDMTKAADNLRMFRCDSSVLLWWKCEHHSLYSAAHYRLDLKDGYATASTNSSAVWKKGGSKENLCDQPYRVVGLKMLSPQIHTLGEESCQEGLLTKKTHGMQVVHQQQGDKWE